MAMLNNQRVYTKAAAEGKSFCSTWSWASPKPHKNGPETLGEGDKLNQIPWCFTIWLFNIAMENHHAINR